MLVVQTTLKLQEYFRNYLLHSIYFDLILKENTNNEYKLRFMVAWEFLNYVTIITIIYLIMHAQLHFYAMPALPKQ